MTLTIADEYNLNVDRIKSVKLALIHDIQEYLTGEIDSKLIEMGDVTKEEKFLGELKAVRNIEKRFGWFGKEISNLWFDFEDESIKEVRYVKALDKIEAITHLINIRTEHYYNDLEYTATYADKAVSNFPELKPLLKDVKKKLREKCEKFGGRWKSKYDLI